MAAPDQLQTGALCSLVDVAKRVPGYEPGDETTSDDILNDLILRESADFQEAAGREILAMNADAFRLFDVTGSVCRRRQLPIGDVAAVTKLELLDFDGTTNLGEIAAAQYVLLPRAREAWRPYRRLTFPYRPGSVVLLAPGRTLKLTGTFGFPAIPVTVRQAIATFVVYRYLNDHAADGTPFAELANREEFNMTAALRVAIDTRDRLSGPGFA